MSQFNRKYQILKDYVIGNTNWQHSSLHQINLSDAVLRGIDLTASTLLEINMRGCNLEFADLSSTNIHKCNLHNARLKGANFSGAILNRVNLSYTYLELACFRNTNFTDVDLSNAYLCCADLRGACLKGANLDNALLAGAIYDDTTSFGDQSVIQDMIHFSDSDQRKSEIANAKLENSEEIETAIYFSYRGIKYQSANTYLESEIQRQLLTNRNSINKAKKYRGVTCA